MSYKDVQPPEGKPARTYTTYERRAEVLAAIVSAGHPDHISRTEFGKRYDVSPSTITRDIDTLRSEIVEELGTDADLITGTVYQRAIRELMDEGEWVDAVRIVESFNDWLFDRGEIDREPEEKRVEMEVAEKANEQYMRMIEEVEEMKDAGELPTVGPRANPPEIEAAEYAEPEAESESESDPAPPDERAADADDVAGDGGERAPDAPPGLPAAVSDRLDKDTLADLPDDIAEDVPDDPTESEVEEMVRIIREGET
jgi:hypothetical protein